MQWERRMVIQAVSEIRLLQIAQDPHFVYSEGCKNYLSLNTVFLVNFQTAYKMTSQPSILA